MRLKLVAYLEITGAMALAGSTIVVGKVLATALPVFLISGLRFAFASIIVLPILIRSRSSLRLLTKRDWLITGAQSFAGNVLFSIFLLSGLRWTSAMNSGVITSTTPAVIGLIAFLFLKERINQRGLIGIILAVAGALLINIVTPTAGGSGILLGNILVGGAVICESIWSILGKLNTGKVSPLVMSSIMCILALIMFFPLTMYQFDVSLLQSLPLFHWILLFYYGIATVMAYLLWYRGIIVVSASVAGVFTAVMPVCACVLSFLFLHEAVSWAHLLGGVCVLLALVLISMKASECEKERPILNFLRICSERAKKPWRN